jgi:hypothetical protein
MSTGQPQCGGRERGHAACSAEANDGGLKANWESLFCTPAPNNSRSYLELRLSYRVQELTLVGLSRETRRTLDLLADEIEGRVGRKTITLIAATRWSAPASFVNGTGWSTPSR